MSASASKKPHHDAPPSAGVGISFKLAAAKARRRESERESWWSALRRDQHLLRSASTPGFPECPCRFYGVAAFLACFVAGAMIAAVAVVAVRTDLAAVVEVRDWEAAAAH